ncbi:MAG: entry exclusion 1 domain-containing protein [Rhodospirillales bacterium]|nr:entry exclusion 1 domain-containing protein [Rhodospirillales bacterium]
MAKVGAQRAAELTGKSKSTIQRAMKSGKISYEVDNNGRRLIDVSELDRAFGLTSQASSPAEDKTVENEIEKASQILEMERMKMRIRMLEDQIEASKDTIEDLKEQRDQWQKQAQQVLLTSQYSQKQAEELKEELKERERRSQIRRQQKMEQSRVGNENRKTGPIEKQRQADKKSSFSGLWQKIRGPETNSKQKAAS